jgi:hypothetical protein
MAFGRIGMGISIAEPDGDDEEEEEVEDKAEVVLEFKCGPPNGVDDD